MTADIAQDSYHSIAVTSYGHRAKFNIRLMQHKKRTNSTKCI